MTLQVDTWEHGLLAQAYAPLTNRPANRPQDSGHALAHGIAQAQAYLHCRTITRAHSRTFALAAALLPLPQRRAIWALYAFCRTSDDLVDRGNGDRAQQLRQWRQRSLHPQAADTDPVVVAWADTRARYHIPRQYAEQLLDGVANDLTRSRYDTFDELAHYCYGVASTVGLMVMHIVNGAAGDGATADEATWPPETRRSGFLEAIPYAVKLGVALQLTNILRDVGEDWGNGRLYLPREELDAFGLNETTFYGVVDDRWRAFMRFQIDRARRLYAEALPGVAMLGGGQFAIHAAAGLYRAILDDIEGHDYDVFTRRAHTSDWRKLTLLPGIWREAIRS